MKNLTFKRNSWHSILYASSYGRTDMPDNICAYFWKLVLAIILFIPAIPGHILNLITWSIYKLKKNKTYEYEPCHALYIIIHIPLIFICSMLVYNEKTHLLFGHYKLTMINSYWCGWVLLLMICGVGIMGVLLTNLCDFIFSRKTRKIKLPNPLVEGFKNIKGKYCTKINWN